MAPIGTLDSKTRTTDEFPLKWLMHEVEVLHDSGLTRSSKGDSDQRPGTETIPGP
jgi:hypothetical protein